MRGGSIRRLESVGRQHDRLPRVDARADNASIEGIWDVLYDEIKRVVELY